MSFTERDRPTLVHGMDGSQIPAEGEFTIDAATGRLHQTTMVLEHEGTSAQLTTEFTEHEDLGLWLPRFLTERYEHTDNDVYELVVAESACSNYRRFDVNVIIK